METHEKRTITNSMQARTRPAIYLGPTGNFQGSVKFMCVETGLKIVQRNYTKLPMPNSLIKKVNLLAKRDKAAAGVLFRNRNQESFAFENEEYDPMPQEREESAIEIHPNVPAEFPGPDLERGTKNEAIAELQNDEDENLEAAEAEQNCNLGEIPMATIAKPDEQNDET